MKANRKIVKNVYKLKKNIHQHLEKPFVEIFQEELKKRETIMKPYKNEIKKKVKEHLKDDIKTFKKESDDDKKLIKKIDKSKNHRRKKEDEKGEYKEKREEKGERKEKRDPKTKMTKGQKKIERVMREFKENKLHSGSKSGPEVTNPKQAIAIALSETRKKGLKVPKKKK